MFGFVFMIHQYYQVPGEWFTDVEVSLNSHSNHTVHTACQTDLGERQDVGGEEGIHVLVEYLF